MEGSKQTFFDRLKEATGVVATKAREGIEELQTRQELSRAYSDLGRTTAELVESGAISHPDVNAAVEKIKALKADLAAAEAAESGEPAPPSEPTPPAG
jgi:multidrug resistance efflux pump